MKTTDLDDRAVLRSLRRHVCPACGGPKLSAQTLCRKDYHRLPQALQFALYRRVGEGYREAVVTALIALKVERPHLEGHAPILPSPIGQHAIGNTQ